jgi:hypothetical protein
MVVVAAADARAIMDADVADEDAEDAETEAGEVMATRII